MVEVSRTQPDVNRTASTSDVVMHSHPGSLLGEVSSDDFVLLSLNLPVYVVGVRVKEECSVMKCVLSVLNLGSGDSDF